MPVEKPPSILSLEEFDESINILVYGDSGVGKTVLGGSATDSRTLILATDRGSISAKRQGSKAEVWKVENWEGVEEALDWLKSGGTELYDWVIVDSLEKMQQYLLANILEIVVSENPTRDLDIPSQGDHQKWQLSFKRFVRKFCDLPVNVMFTATAMRSENEEGEDIVLPSIHGKGYGMSNWVCAEMHVVAYLSCVQKKKGEGLVTVRRLQTQTVPPYFGKDRYNCLGKYVNGEVVAPYLDRPNLSVIEKMISESGENSMPARKVSSRRAPATRRRRPAAK